MDSKAAGRIANLKQYRAVNGKMAICPDGEVNGKPRPEVVLIDGKPERSKGGTFYLEWREDSKRKTRPVGTAPREALNAWQLQTSILFGTAETPLEDPAGIRRTQ